MTDSPPPSTAAPAAEPAAGISRRRLFELGGAGAALAALLSGCGGADAGAPGRVGFAPAPSEPPDESPDDVVYLRTLTSQEYSIVATYEQFTKASGLDGAAAAVLARLLTDHKATAELLADLTTEAGGEPFACPNPWFEERFIRPTVAHVLGDDSASPPVPASDDVVRDTVGLMHSLEAWSAASYLRFVELMSTPARRRVSADLGSQAARRTATVALISNPPPAGFVAPTLLAHDGLTLPTAPPDTQAADAPAPIPPVYAINNRFAQLTAVNVEVGAPNELGQRHKTVLDTPAENAYVYTSLSC